MPPRRTDTAAVRESRVRAVSRRTTGSRKKASTVATAKGMSTGCKKATALASLTSSQRATFPAATQSRAVRRLPTDRRCQAVKKGGRGGSGMAGKRSTFGMDREIGLKRVRDLARRPVDVGLGLARLQPCPLGPNRSRVRPLTRSRDHRRPQPTLTPYSGEPGREESRSTRLTTLVARVLRVPLALGVPGGGRPPELRGPARHPAWALGRPSGHAPEPFLLPARRGQRRPAGHRRRPPGRAGVGPPPPSPIWKIVAYLGDAADQRRGLHAGLPLRH